MKLKRKHIIFEDNGMLDDNPWNRKDSVGKKKSKSDLEGLEIVELYVHTKTQRESIDSDVMKKTTSHVNTHKSSMNFAFKTQNFRAQVFNITSLQNIKRSLVTRQGNQILVANTMPFPNSSEMFL